jgi:urease accessory protein
MHDRAWGFGGEDMGGLTGDRSGIQASVRAGWIAAISMVAFFFMHGVAGAHTGEGTLGGFVSGFKHPILGLDHLLAMLAVGIWGAQMGGRSVWTLPVTFPLVMAVGGFLGAAGVPFPFVEPGIALSVLGFGLVIALALKPVEWVALVGVGIFALLHGHAHGTELPEAADAVSYGIGFVVATGLIHLAGIGLGILAGSRFHGRITRACGAAISLVGVYFLIGTFS